MQQLIDWSGYHFLDCEKVLDVGCGNGMVSEYLCQKYPGINMIAIDNNIDMLNSAMTDCVNAKNLHFQLMDARELNFSADQFDLIISTACLH